MIPGLRTYGEPEITEQVKGLRLSTFTENHSPDAQYSLDTGRFLSVGPLGPLYHCDISCLEIGQ